MLDPDLTNVLKRRIGASLIDLGIVGLVTTLVWRTQLIAFPITSTDAISGEPIFDPAQIVRQDEIAERLNTSFTWNNTLYALDQSGFVLTALCAIVMLALVFILLPANTGWSPGKKLLSLGVVDAEGRNPSLADYAKRSVVGLVDLMPVILPGLAGWVVANTDEYRQRLGDRFAKTYVIDNRAGPKFIDPTVYERRRELRRNSLTGGAPADDGMVEIGDRLGGSPSGLRRDEHDLSPVPLVDESLPPTPELAPVDHQSEPAPEARPLPQVAPAPVIDHSTEAPPPDHRFALDAHAPTNELGFVDTDRPDLGLGAPSTLEPTQHEAPEPIHANEMALPVPTDSDWGDDPVRAGDPVEPRPTVRAEATGDPAVPRPTHRVAAVAQPVTEEAVAAEPVTAEPVTAEPVAAEAVTEKSSAEPPAWDQPVPEEAPVWVPHNESAVATATTPPAEPAESTDSTEPAQPAPGLVWNDQWQAWLFWDPKHEHWLRHDIDNDRWIPIS